MERLRLKDTQHLLKIVAIVTMVLIFVVFVSISLHSLIENKIKELVFSRFATVSQETGYTIEYDRIELNLFSSVVLDDLKIKKTGDLTPLCTVEEVYVNFSLRELIKGPSRKDMYITFVGLDLQVEESKLEDVRAALQQLFALSSFQDDLFIHITGTQIIAELINEDTYVLGVEIPHVMLLMANKQISGAADLPLQISFSGDAFLDTEIDTLVDFSYAMKDKQGSATIYDTDLTYGEMILEDIVVSGVVTPEHVSADINLTGLQSHLSFDQTLRDISTTLVLADFDVKEFVEVLGIDLPEQISTEMIPLVSAELIASYNLDTEEYSYDGNISIDDMSLNDSFELGKTRITATGTQDFVKVKELDTSIMDYLVHFSGSFEDYLFFEPTGILTVTEEDTDVKLAQIDFKVQDDGILISISSDLLESASVQTIGSIDAENIILDGELTYQKDSYDFSADLDISKRTISADIEHGTGMITADLSDSPISFSGRISDYTLGSFGSLSEASFSGTYIDINDWMIETENLKINDIIYNDNEVLIDLSAVLTPDSMVLRNIELIENDEPLYGSGSVTYAFKDLLEQPMIISMELSNEEERFLVEARYEDQWLSATVDIIDSRLSRYPVPVGNGYAKGYVSINGNLDDFLVSGTMEIENGRRLRSSYSGNVKFDITPDRFKIESFTGNVGDVTVTDLDFIYDFSQQKIDAIAAIELTMDRRDFQSNITITSVFDRYDINLGNFRSIFKEKELFFDIAMIDILIDKEKISNQYAKAVYQNKTLRLYDEEQLGFNVEYHTGDGTFSAEVKDKYPISFTMDGVLKDGEIDAVSNDVELEFSFYQQLGLPFLTFNEGSATGRLNITGSLGDLVYYGEFFGDSIAASIPYVPEDLHIDDIYISLIGKEIIFAPFYIRTQDTVNEATFKLYIDDVIPTGMDLRLMIDEEQSVPIDYEFTQFKIKYIGRGSGDISLGGDFKELSIIGDATISDGMVSLLLKAKKKVTLNPIAIVDLTVKTGKNLNAVFPNPELPILTVVAKEGEELTVIVQHAQNKFNASGKIGIRGGEIIYFQKNFYITEGVLDLNFTQDTIDPKVSLIAKLKDFDSSGEKVDIILSVEDDSVFDLSPSFSASPNKTLTEISQILGNNIIPDDISGNNDLSTALAVATLATDVIQQVGIIDIDPIDDLELSIRNALNLDLFSIRTQVIQNILLDTIPGDFSSTITRNPIARYLDNTTIFLGKYITDDMFIQAIMQLTVNDDYNTGLFITDDIGLDFEVSYEWNNPLNTLIISMAPESLAIKDILDSISIGMSWKLAL